ncbi:hypothetical protein AAFF_G00247160 [Aldrovandia affinis]|uniref:Cysteine-rich and transmembrane domain-containing protein 1 n=1 Tax=Aldrovandia affinis TaxID=143900 RepID=A0AAD7WTW2_9TELE|nr:hypothetical protein AAFF_G00247160 [Aldrovandia affinis]
MTTRSSPLPQLHLPYSGYVRGRWGRGEVRVTVQRRYNFKTPPRRPSVGYPAQAYQPQAYPAYTEQPNPAYPNFHPGAADPYAPQPGYQGYAMPPQPQYGWQNAPPMAPLYGEPPKNTVYVVDERRRDDSGDTCLTACWTALCCCCLLDMLT